MLANPAVTIMVYCIRWKHGVESKWSLLFYPEYLRSLPLGHCSLLYIKDLIFGIDWTVKVIYSFFFFYVQTHLEKLAEAYSASKISHYGLLRKMQHDVESK